MTCYQPIIARLERKERVLRRLRGRALYRLDYERMWEIEAALRDIARKLDRLPRY